MAKELKAGWVCIATSGSVVHGEEDGRFIKKEWLQQMADNYNVKTHTACLWAEHERWYGAFGKVLALKAEPATEAELKGELQLFAILAPNNSLIRANAEGRFCYPSIEVGENFRSTGTYFLKGLGVTDEPASAGVTELKFSKKGKEETLLVASGHQFNLAEELEAEKVTLLDRIFGKTPTDNPEPDTMTDKSKTTEGKAKPEAENAEFSALVEAVTTRLGEVVDDKLTAFAKAHGLEKPEAEGKDDVAPEESKAYAKLKADFDALKNEFAALKNTPEKGTEVPEGEGDGEASYCL